MTMHPAIEAICDKYNLKIESPFEVNIDGKNYSLQYLLKGYGAKNGMVIDKAWSNLELITDRLVKMGYGYSCFDLEDSKCIEFQDVLNDWGISNA